MCEVGVHLLREIYVMRYVEMARIMVKMNEKTGTYMMVMDEIAIVSVNIDISDLEGIIMGLMFEVDWRSIPLLKRLRRVSLESDIGLRYR